MYHNHFDGSSTSIDDASNLAMPGVEEVVAVGPDGKASSVRLTDEFGKALDQMDWAQRADILPDLLRELIDSVVDNVKEAKNNANLPKNLSDRFQREIMNQALVRNGLTEYMPSEKFGGVNKFDGVSKARYNKLQGAADKFVAQFLGTRSISLPKKQPIPRL